MAAKRARTERREAKRAGERALRREEREREANVRERQALAALAPGGRADHPLVVASASLVEAAALRHVCLQCLHPLRVVEHRATTGARGEVLRPVHLSCVRCGAKRVIFATVQAPVVH